MMVLWLTACALGSTLQPTATPAAAKIDSAGPTLTVTALPLPTDTPPPPTPTATTVIDPTVRPSSPQAAGPGTVAGRSCYPSSQPPSMTVHLQNQATAEEFELQLAQGQTEFRAELMPGEYTAFAATVGTEVTGGYSQAVACGLGEACKDHRLLPFQVSAGQTVEQIDLCDWYEPPRVVAGPAGPVMVETLQRMNVHVGPSLNSPILADVPPRTIAEAVGRSVAGAWLQVQHSQAGPVWIYGPLIKLSGQPENLPVIPTEFDPPASEGPLDQFIPASWSTEANESVVHFKGSIIDQTGQVVNGYSVLLYNGTWSVLSHPTGASHHYPDVRDGAWDLIINNAADAAGWWALTVVSYDCPDFNTGFNAQCKEFTPLSETQIVKIVFPDENVVNADWICQRDCNRGLYVEPFRRE